MIRKPSFSSQLGSLLVLFSIAATGCSDRVAASSPDPESTTPPSTAPPAAPTSDSLTTTVMADLPTTVTDAHGNTVEVDSIDRIIPLDGTVAEVVFALGRGQNVVATDLSATYPPEADALPEIGYQRSLSAEAIAAFNPTVLLATDIAGPEGTINDLRQLGYPVVIIPNEQTSTGPAEKIRAVGAALGMDAAANELADQVQTEIDAATQTAAAPDGLRVAALYVRGTSTQLLLGTDTATHWLITAAGGTNIAVEMGVVDSIPISAEAILAQAPDVIIVPQAGLDSVGGVDELLSIGGLAATPAGQSRTVLAYDDQLLLGNGPRSAQVLTDLIHHFSLVNKDQD